LAIRTPARRHWRESCCYSEEIYSLANLLNDEQAATISDGGKRRGANFWFLSTNCNFQMMLSSMQKSRIKLFALGAISFALLGTTESTKAAAVYSSEIAYYSLNGNVNNSIGAGLYNGTVIGVPRYATGLNQALAFSFNGGRKISTTTPANLGLVDSSFTVDAWVNFSFPTLSSFSVFGTSATGAQDQGLQLGEQNDKPYFGFYMDDTQGNTVINPNTWYNIAWVYEAGNQDIYVNGLLDVSSSGHFGFDGTSVVTIGGSCCSSNMNGLIEDVGIFDAALTQSQIQALIAPEPSSLVDILGLCGAGLVVLVLRQAAKAVPMFSRFDYVERTRILLDLQVFDAADERQLGKWLILDIHRRFDPSSASRAGKVVSNCGSQDTSI
jgi:hypothetical protein